MTMGGATKAATFSIARCTPWRQAPIAASPPGISAADVIATRLLPRAVRKSRENLRFSSEGAVELVRLHRRALASLSLASNVLVSEDLEAARLLLEEKTEVARMERQSRRRHLARLGAGRFADAVALAAAGGYPIVPDPQELRSGAEA